MGIKIKKLIFEIPTEKSAFAIQTLFFFVLEGVLFRSEMLLFGFALRKKFHASCGTLSHSKEPFWLETVRFRSF